MPDQSQPDIAGALRAGVPLSKIVDRLAESVGADSVGARAAGHTDVEMLGRLAPWFDVSAIASPADPNQGDFSRGAETALKQLPALTKGTIGAAGAAAERVFGSGGVSTAVKNWGLEGYQADMKKMAPLSKETDSFTTAWERAKQGDPGALADWAQYAMGYGLAQVGESAATALLGAVVGGAAGTAVAPGPGTVVAATVGGAEGLIAKGAVKSLAKQWIEKEVAKAAVTLAEKKLGQVGTAEVAELAATEAVRRQATKAIAAGIGSTTALGALGVNQEVGSIYGDAVQKAQEEGRELDGADLARVWGSGLAAGGVEAFADKIGLGLLSGKVLKPGASRVGNALKSAAAGSVTEGATEATQTEIERYGAGKSLTGSEAIRDVIDSAAQGALPGGVAGGVGGAMHRGASPVRDAHDEKAIGDIASAQDADAAIAAFSDLMSAGDNLAAANTALEAGPVPGQIEVAPGTRQAVGAETARADLAGAPYSPLATGVQPAPGVQASRLDRQMSLLGLAAQAGFESEQQNALAQERVVRGEPKAGGQAGQFADLTPMTARQAQQRMAVLSNGVGPSQLEIVPHPSQLGTFAIKRAQGSEQASPVDNRVDNPADAQHRIESAALAGKDANRRSEDAGRQALINRVLKAIEARGGVASPYEARVVQEAGLGKPYDRIDESLAPPMSVPEALTAATGIAVGNQPRSSGATPETKAAKKSAEAKSEQAAREAAAAEGAARRESERVASNEQSMSEREAALAKRDQYRAVGEKATQAAANRVKETPDPARVMAALKAPPFARTVEQRALLAEARQTFTAAEMETLSKKANRPFEMTAEDHVALRRMQDHAAHQAATSPNNSLPEPTAAQKEAGNYKVGRLTIGGLDISVENPEGSVRSGTDANGKVWRTQMKHHYGYIRGSVGMDKDHVDAFVVPGTPENYDGPVFVIDQIDPRTGRPDEHKVILGVDSEKAARAAYAANYSKGWGGLKAVTQMSMAEFKAWVTDHEKTAKPAAKTAKKSESREAKWQTLDDNIPTEAAAERIIAMRKKSDAWSSYEFRAVPSDWHENGSLMVQARKRPAGAKSEQRPEDSTPRAARPQAISIGMAKVLEEMARSFGLKVEFFTSEDPNAGDGYVDADSTTIHLNEVSSVPHLAVLGHEIMHLVRRALPGQYAAVEAAVAAQVREDSDAEYTKYYNGEAADMREEMVADLAGNRWMEPAFIEAVFNRLAEQSPKGYQKLIDAVAKAIRQAVDAALRVLNGQKGFKTDEFVKDITDIRSALETALVEFAKVNKAEVTGKPAKSTSRSDVRDAPAFGTPQENSVEATGIHYSKQERNTLVGSAHGTGMRGAERERNAGPRIHFYVDTGNGVQPEDGVGSVAHAVRLRNLYDADADPLDLVADNKGATAFEKAVEAEGFDGFYTRSSKQALAVVLGDKRVPVSVVGRGPLPPTGVAPPGRISAERTGWRLAREKLLSSKALPSGALTPDRWKKILGAVDPTTAAALDSAGVWGRLAEGKAIYKDELAAALRPQRSTVRQTETPEFKRWFGDSKVVDGAGQPQVVYHGASRAFSAFDIQPDSEGAYFTTNREAAEDYGDHVIAAYLSIENPVELSSEDWASGNAPSRREAEQKGYDGYLIRDHDISGAAGEDSIHSAVGDTWIAFKPEQIKSAIGNNGRFDSSNPNITQSTKRTDYVMGLLTPAEREKMREATAKNLVSLFNEFPSGNEMAAVAFAGRAKRGWYRRSAEALSLVFGADAPRFAALLAALSPQTSVENNLQNALRVWKNWSLADRPTNEDAIRKIMGRSVQGSKGFGSVLPAWIPNSLRALTADDPTEVVLSGPKVNSFMQNLVGNTVEVTNDAWMANFALVDQTLFSGKLSAAGTDPGKGTGYLAMSARVREAASVMSKMTGETWTPAEVQETVWSWAKTLYETQAAANESRGARELVLDRAITDEMISATPDFGSLLNEDAYASHLRGAGLDPSRADAARRAEPGAAGQEGPFTADAQERYELQAARRLERLYTEGNDAFATRDELLARQRSPARGVAERLRDAYRKDRGTDLEGLPGGVNVPGVGMLEFHSFKPAQDAAVAYMREAGLPYDPPTDYVKVDRDRARLIADAYEAMPHAPNDPEVKAAFEALANETLAQYKAVMDAGLKVEFIDFAKQGDPYAASPRLAIADIVANNHMWVFSTRDGFGTSEFDPSGNPMLQETEFKISGKTALVNDLFRVVHDYFGHAKEGVGFRADGEENAWRMHSAMFSPQAQRALTTETRGQNSWLNFGPHGDTNRTANVNDTVFADQKTGLLPLWASEDGRRSAKRAVEVFAPKKVASLLEQDDWAILTAANPMGVQAAEADNAIAMRLLRDDLDQMGLSFADTVGKYGQVEPGFAITGITREQAMALSKKYNQESFLNHEGFVYPDGRPTTEATGVTEFEKAPDDFYTEVPATGAKFAVDLKWSTARDDGDVGGFRKNMLDRVKTNVEYGAMLGRQHEWAYNVGDQLLSKKTGKVYTLTARSFQKVGKISANDWQPVYRYETSDGEKGTFNERLMLETKSLVNLTTPQWSTKRQTETPEFKKWFEGSKVVDEDGQPKVVYHGTIVRPLRDGTMMGDIAAFDRMFTTRFRRASIDTVGSWFSDNAGEGGAQMYTGGDGAPGAAIYPVYLSIKNPQVTTFALMLRRARLLANGEDDGRMVGQAEVDAYRAWLAEMGKDGVKIEGSGTEGSTEFDNQVAWIALNPSQIKSATGNNGGFDPTNPDITRSTRRAPFYSALSRGVSEMKTEKAPAAGWRDAIKGLVAKGIVKADEVEWTGINEWLDLQTGKVPRQAVVDFLSAHGVQVGETVLGNGGLTREELQEIRELEDLYRRSENGEEGVFDSDDFNRLQDLQEQTGDGSLARYSQYTLPGGSDYREVLLTLPYSPKYQRYEAHFLTTERGGAMRNGGSWTVILEGDPDGSHIGSYGTQAEAEAAAARHTERAASDSQQILAKGERDKSYRSNHWEGVPNVLAHIRLNDRTDADGKRVLFVEEIQSDWAQEGKRNGFKITADDLVAKPFDGGIPNRWEVFNKRTGARVVMAMGATEKEAIQAGLAQAIGTPRAPFVGKTDAWVSLALKRVIKMAVDEGYDRVAFINGEQSVDRYDLSKQVDRVLYERVGDNRWNIEVYGPRDQSIVDKVGIPTSEVEDLIGKELTQKMADGAGVRVTPNSTSQWMRLSGLDLKVGGEGMRAFYDKIVPAVAKDVLKKLGGQLSQIDFAGRLQVVEGRGGWMVYDPATKTYWRGGSSGRSWVDYPQNARVFLSEKTARNQAVERDDALLSSQLGFDVTPAMREKAESGLPLFSPRRHSLGALTQEQERALRDVGGITENPTLQQRLAKFKIGLGMRAKQALVDQFAPLAELDQRAYVMARMSKGSTGTTEALMLFGKPYMNGDVPDVNVQDGGFAKVLASLEGEQDRFLWWVAAQRAEGLAKIGMENLFTGKDIAALKSLEQGTLASGKSRTAAYAKALQDLNDFNDAVLKVAEDSGLIDPAARALFKDMPYVPFYRVMSDEQSMTGGKRFSSGLVNQRAWKKLKGGSQKLNADLLANMLQNWDHLFAASARNRAAVQSLRAAEAMGAAFESPVAGKGTVRVMENGETKYFMIDDPQVLAAVSALEYVAPEWFKPLSTFKRWLTIGVTASPAFKIRNLLRDSLSAVAQSDLSLNPVANIVSGWKDSKQTGQVYASMLASGGVLRFGTMLEGDQATRAHDLIARVGGKVLDETASKKLLRQMHDVLHAYNEFGDRTENINRVALYKKLVAEGRSHTEASFMARDLLDFSMSGRAPVVRFLAQTVPFFNARLQGLYKLGRAATDNPQRFYAVAGAVSMASLALMLFYQDDKDWKKREDWDRDGYWWFKIGETAYRIPKPFEVGAIGTLAERSWELAFNKDMTGRRFGQRISSMLFQTFAFDPTPQLVKPLLDVYANQDSFSGRAIESQSMENMRPEDRVTESTSTVARVLGELGLPDPAQLAKGRYAALSPVQIDYLTRAYFGWLGATAVAMVDAGMRPMSGRGQRPDYTLKDLSMGFAETQPGLGSRYVSAFYDEATLIEQAWASYQAAVKRGDSEGVREVLSEEGPRLAAHGLASQTKNKLAEINAAMRQVEANRVMPGDQKRETLNRLTQARSAVAEAALLGIKR